MSQFYKVLKADQLGTPYESHGKQIQTFWCQLEGVDKDVSIGKQVPNTLTPGEQVYGDLMYAKSQRGTEYWKFKSAQVPEGVTRPASSPAQAVAQQATGRQVDMSATQPDWFQPWANMILDTYKMVKELHGGLEKGAAVKEPATPSVEPVDEETMAVVNEIFPDSVPEDVPEGV